VLVVTPQGDVDAGRLVSTLPPGWAVVNGDGGQVDSTGRTLTWDALSIPAFTTVSEQVILAAPSLPTLDGRFAVQATFGAELYQGDDRTIARSVSVLVAPRVVLEHSTLEVVDRSTLAVTDLPLDQAIYGEQRYSVFRVGFVVQNEDSSPVAWTPQLEYAPTGGGFSIVPSGEAILGLPFYTAPEWRPNNGPGGGTALKTGTEPVAGSSLHVGGDGGPVNGFLSMGVNPGPALLLPGLSYTVVSFSVRATADAPYLGSFSFRLTDDGQPFPAATSASVSLGLAPPLDLTPGQKSGVLVGSSPSVAYQLVSPMTGGAPLPRYPLQAEALPAASGASPHGPAAGDTCAICHSSHSGSYGNLLRGSGSQSATCFTCHNGSGAVSNVENQYAAVSSPDVPSDRAYFRHDALIATTHISADVNEFQDSLGKPILNRHTECADCHDPHLAVAADSTETPAGWTAPGALADISGFSVVNGAAGSSPTYTFTTSITLEYQLCFKCHSGATTLLSNAGYAPSREELDKGVEFNPANLSFHPIEAPGRNATPAMAASLAGTSPYKLWTFTTGSAIRCLSCHGDSKKFNLVTPPAAGSDLAVHANANRGLLLQPYRDRILTTAGALYDASNFALCYVCHAEAPFVDETGNARPDTNFRFHGLHVSGLPPEGPDGTNIDAPNNGSGQAICAECHFRIHSTIDRVGGQAEYPRLVNFAPDVTAPDSLVDPTGANAWTGPAAKTCTLTCHGFTHDKMPY